MVLDLAAATSDVQQLQCSLLKCCTHEHRTVCHLRAICISFVMCVSYLNVRYLAQVLWTGPSRHNTISQTLPDVSPCSVHFFFLILVVHVTQRSPIGAVCTSPFYPASSASCLCARLNVMLAFCLSRERFSEPLIREDNKDRHQKELNRLTVSFLQLHLDG